MLGLIGKKACVAAVAAVLGLGAAQTALADEIRVGVPLVPGLGVPVSASGIVEATVDIDDNYVDDERLRLSVEGLPRGEYGVLVNGIANRTLRIVGSGRGSTSLWLDDSVPVLEVEVIGFGGGVLLSSRIDAAAYSGNDGHRDGDDRQNFRYKASFENLAAPPRARGSLVFQSNRRGTMLRLNVSRLDAFASYDIVLDGVAVETVAADRRGRIRDRFASNPSGRRDRPLDFDPAQRTLELVDRSTGVVVMRAWVGGTPVGDVVGDARVLRFTLGIAADAGPLRGEAALWLEPNETELEIDLDRAVPGRTYTVMLDNVEKGSGVAKRDGDLDFELNSRPGRGDSDDVRLPLTVDPLGRTLRIIDETTGRVVASAELTS
jgi:hypothetical protein